MNTLEVPYGSIAMRYRYSRVDKKDDGERVSKSKLRPYWSGLLPVLRVDLSESAFDEKPIVVKLLSSEWLSRLKTMNAKRRVCKESKPRM